MEYALAHPYLTAILLYVFIRCSAGLLVWPFRLATYWLRHRSIMYYGWPPDHIDADGDAIPLRQEVKPDRQPASV